MIPRWVVSEHARVAWRGGRLELSSGLSGAALGGEDPELLRAVHAFARPRTAAEARAALAPSPPPRLEVWLDDLVRAGVLVPAGEPEPPAAHGWDPAALAYYRRASRPGEGRPVEPAAPPAPGRCAIPLPRAAPARGRDLLDVLEARRSTRAFAADPVPLPTLSRWLWACASDRGTAAGGGGSALRAYPSGGAIYSLELYPVLGAGAVEGVPAGVYRYAPDRHALDPRAAGLGEAVPFLEAAGRAAGAAAPPVAVVITSRIARQAEHYGALAYSLVLQEAGGLLQTMYLVATALGLGACALGAAAPAGRLARLCGTTELAEPVVGELMLGSPRSPEP